MSKGLQSQLAVADLMNRIRELENRLQEMENKGKDFYEEIRSEMENCMLKIVENIRTESKFNEKKNTKSSLKND